ncbi:MAG TPA: isocitrate lyase/PEP mutase family protein [Steroidobacteraceae bacterium]|jgi:2-methylisocitrate lyase-like PEP mutase family enzyme
MAADKSEALRAAHRSGAPLITPLAHDAFSARLIAAAGFPAFNIGGSSLLAARYGLPDLGIAALGEMTSAIQDVVGAVGLPCLADADDGYGDIKSVVRTIQSYEQIGVAGLLLEDQARAAKQPGDSAALAVLPTREMVQRLRAALAARRTGLVVIARTDALGLEGLDGALRRAEQYLRAGADGVFVAGLTTQAQYERVGAAFRGSWNMAAQFEGRSSPWLTPQALHALGFSQIAYPMLLIQRIAGVLEQTLASLRQYAAGERASPAHVELLSASGFRTAVELDRWTAIERGGGSEGGR